jgi:hypothetical protein
MPSYQAKPLVEYEQAYLAVAQDIFGRVSREVPVRQLSERKGSFTIRATSSDEAAAKIVVYDPEIGKQRGLPFMRDGVYIWIRENNGPGAHIWGDVMPLEMPWFFRRMERQSTIAIAPNYDAKFTYFPVMAGDDLDEIASLLIACSRV